ncbi:MAG: alkaline phosphatase family protein [Williamsia herbipolensis]|nr:alkaline phosphatase family protein [Williamsia herbipolensis]
MRNTTRTRVIAAAAAAAAVAVTVGALAAPATAATHTADATSTAEHVVVIGIDGLLYDRIGAADAPNLDAMITSGYSSKTTLYSDPMAPTLSGPGWATNLTGVWPDKHGVTSNSWVTGTDLSRFPDFLTRLERADPSLSTFADVSWNPIVDGSVGTPIITSDVDDVQAANGDADTAARAVTKLRDAGPNASFIHFDGVDEAGHASGAASQQYLDAITEVDGFIGQVRTAVAARSDAADWSFIVTSDHGHTNAGGHGGNTPAERSSFIVKTGPGIAKQTPAVAPKNVDIAADVLSTFGVPIPAALDGRPLATTSTDPFDTMASKLQARVDETGIPSSTLGWTKSMPSGWSVDDTGMGTGGMTEWRGWSLASDAFWTGTETGQGREENVRARGVFAVADSDEWSDKSRSGTFDSKIVSAPYTVSGKSTAQLSFASHYRKSGNETASVLVSFDGGSWRTIETYTADRIASIDTQSIAVPSGAKQMRVAWSLTKGDNDWYWAIDDPKVA